MIPRLIANAVQRPLPPVTSGAGVSIVSALISFAEKTLPLVQWIAAAVGIISGLTAITLGIYATFYRKTKLNHPKK